jgi:twinkle protein
MPKTIKREPCPECRSHDNLCTFEGDLGIKQKCLTPGCTFKAKDTDSYKKAISVPNSVQLEKQAFSGEYKAYRGLSKETCQRLDIQIADYNGKEVVIYYHHNQDQSIDIKYRWPAAEDGKKRFSWAEPKSKNTSMFGLHACQDFTKPLIITEGNEDAASYHEIGLQACSLLSSSDWEANIKNDLETLNKFPEIYLSCDPDEPGQIALEGIKSLLKHKCLKVIDHRPLKDANEVLMTDRDVLAQNIQDAQEIVPDGITYGDQIDSDELWTKPTKGLSLPWPGITESLGGLEFGCLYILLAGTSIGKSTILREIAYHAYMSNPELKIANLFLEEPRRVTKLAYAAIHLNVPLKTLKRNPESISKQEQEHIDNDLLKSPRLMFIDKRFDKTAENVLSKIEYLAEVKGFKFFIIDHISCIIGRSAVGSNGERRDIDEFIYRIQELAEQLNIIILAASHVTASKRDKNWDEGAVPSVYSGRGSGVLAQAPDGVIAISRNTTDQYLCDQLSVHVLKNRWDGQLGQTDELIHIASSGRLVLK